MAAAYDAHDDHGYELRIQPSEIVTMWKSLFKHTDLITQLAGAAISSSLLSQYLFTKQSALLSEALSWIILPVIYCYWGSSRCRSGPRATLPGLVEHTPASGASLWAVALAVSSASLYQAEYGIITFFVSHLPLPKHDEESEANFSVISQPALSPLLAAVQTYIEQGGIQAAVKSASGQDKVWVTAFIAMLCIITLTGCDLQASALSGIPVVGLLVIYLALMRSPKTAQRASQGRPIAAGHFIRPLSFRVVITLLAVLGVEIAIFGPPRTTIVDTTVLGVTKSFMWYFLLQTVCFTMAILFSMLTSLRLSIVPGQ
jgi:hypothetical protein